MEVFSRFTLIHFVQIWLKFYLFFITFSFFGFNNYSNVNELCIYYILLIVWFYYRNGGNGNYSALCRNCNGSGHMARDCPEGNKQSCYNCGEQGHLSRECRKRN